MKRVAGTRPAAEPNSAGYMDQIGLTANQAQAIVAKRKQLFAEVGPRAVVILSRGDKTAIELFTQGVGGWDTGLRRRMDDGNSNLD